MDAFAIGRPRFVAKCFKKQSSFDWLEAGKITMEIVTGAIFAAGCSLALIASAVLYFRGRPAMTPEQRKIEDRGILDDSVW
ncbi:hypothetical protein [Bosea sp. Tri-44]|uniref:hypothetical protein n=1 Tax=Bosea sp. Tri-44 TaxID=1972137 RepID=UPI00100E88C0|nr:hypothetical protein [Bosea sp. Tri-44]